MKKTLNSFFQQYIIHIINIFMIILGCMGLLGNYDHSLYFPENTYISIILLGVIGIGFYLYFIKYQTMPQKPCVFIFIILLLVLIILFQSECHYFLNNLQSVIEFDYFLKFDELLPLELHSRDMFYQVIIFIIGLPVIYLIVSTVCTMHFSLIKIISLIFLFMFPVFINHELSSQESYCFIIFICYALLFTVALKYQQKQYTLKIVVIILLCIMSVTASTYLEGNPLFQQESSSVLSQMIDWIANGKGNPLGIATQTGMSRDIDGSLPTGNVQLTNGLALTVQSDIPFSSYLRAYSLANYSDNEWHEVTENYDNSQSLTMYSDFLMLNYLPSFQSVEILPQRQYDFQFVPYYFIDNVQEYPVLFDSYIESTSDSLDVLYLYEEDPQLGLDENSYFISEQYDEEYEDYVYQHYLDVPDELEQQLSRLLYENDIEYPYDFDIASTVQQVQELLAKQAEYDLNAGTLPFDKDFVEYFLFENHKGSCTHFATAGALLLRELGIPTRFVRGYTMLESDFHNGEAKIPQYRSHAWIEVYENMKGWIPYEMTPAGNIEEISDVLDEIASQNQQTANTSDVPTTQPEEDTIQDTPVDLDVTTRSSHQNIWIIAGLFGIFIFIVIYRYLTTHWMMIKTRRMNNNQKVLTYYRKIRKLSSWHNVDDEDLKNLAYKAKYSSHEISDEEWFQFLRYYQQWIRQYSQSLKWYQRFIFQYIFGNK